MVSQVTSSWQPFVSSMGVSANGLLRNLVHPEKPKDKCSQQIVKAMKWYYEPKLLVITGQFQFRKCVQKSSESACQFAVELEHPAAKCDFGYWLDEALHDGFVSKISNEACQQNLLSEDRLTFAKALQLVMNMETSHRDLQQLRNRGGTTASVHRVKQSKRHSPPACNIDAKEKKHSAYNCYFKDSRCHKSNTHKRK